MSKIRLDKALLQYIDTRAKAQDAIKESRILVNGNIITKCSYQIDEEDKIEIIAKEAEYVSRGSYKLKSAIDAFAIDINNQVVLDIGASTGGFTDLCLQCGAKKVYALDVGHLQLAKKLEDDDRVIKMEGYNARYLRSDWFDDDIDFVCMDVSFISCKTILDVVLEQMKIKHLVVLVKPQFECGPQALNKNGILKDKRLALKIVEEIKRYLLVHYHDVKEVPSSIEGRSGNQEYLVYAKELR